MINENLEPTNQSTTETSVETSETPATVEETPADGQATKRANNEAAKYRKRLREVEAERDTLSDALNIVRADVLQKAALETVLPSGQRLVPEAYQDIGLDPQDYFKDNTLNIEKLHTDLQDIADSKAYLFEHEKVIVPNTWDRPERGTSYNTWAASFSPK